MFQTGKPSSTHKQNLNSPETGRTTIGTASFPPGHKGINILQSSFSTVTLTFEIIIVLPITPMTTKDIFHII